MKQENNNEHLAMGKINLILAGVSFFLILLGFVLMGGSASGVKYDPSIYGFRRIVLAPMVSFAGFCLMIVAILFKRKENSK